MTIDIGGTATSQFGRLTTSGAATLDGMLNLALVDGFSPAIGNSFPVMTFGSRTGQFATINGLAIGNGKQFSPKYAATNLTLNVTAAAPIPALPDSDGDGIPDAQELLAGTDPHDPASVLRITHLDKSATGMQMQFPTKPGNPFGCAQGTRTYRLEYTDDLKTPWQLLKDNIPGTGTPSPSPTHRRKRSRNASTASWWWGSNKERRVSNRRGGGGE